MTEANQKSEIRNHKSEITRLALIVLVAAVVLTIGHYGFRAYQGPAVVGAPVPIQFGRSAGSRAPDAPPPPRSKPAFTTSSAGAPGRSLAEYASQAAPEEVLRFYRAEMPRLGWTERKLAPGASGLAVLWYSNAAGDSCIIAVSTQPAAETAVTVLRMPPSGGK
ncbi:MAG: hypothetical protein ABSA67_08470 [Candidatus Brocadiia bacterium]|jgi:hypothetical protein